jgi:hypothetical protein
MDNDLADLGWGGELSLGLLLPSVHTGPLLEKSAFQEGPQREEILIVARGR